MGNSMSKMLATAAFVAASHLHHAYLGTPGNVVDENAVPMANHVFSRHLTADGDMAQPHKNAERPLSPSRDGEESAESRSRTMSGTNSNINEGDYVRIKTEDGSPATVIRKVEEKDETGVWLKIDKGKFHYKFAELEPIGQLKDKNNIAIEEGMNVQFVDGSNVHSGEVVLLTSFATAPDVYEAKVRVYGDEKMTPKIMYGPVEEMEIIGFDYNGVMIQDKSAVKLLVVVDKGKRRVGDDGNVVGFVMDNGRQKVRVQFHDDSEDHVYLQRQLSIVGEAGG